MRVIPHIIIDNKEYKRCSKCKIVLTLDMFSICREKRDGLKHLCKECCRASYARYASDPQVKKNKSIYTLKRIKEDINIKIKTNLACRLRLAIKSNLCGVKSRSTLDYLGCSIEFFKEYMKEKFKDGMTWENHGRYGWHIDHIIPCCEFDLSLEEEQNKCFHYSNLQPLWMEDNLSKGGRYIL